MTSHLYKGDGPDERKGSLGIRSREKRESRKLIFLYPRKVKIPNRRREKKKKEGKTSKDKRSLAKRAARGSGRKTKYIVWKSPFLSKAGYKGEKT